MYLNPAVCTRIFRKLIIFLLSPSYPNMNTKRSLEKSTFEFNNVEVAYTQADFDSHSNDTNGRDISVASVDTGVILACKNASGPGSVLYTIVLDSSSAREGINEDIVLNGNELLTVGETLSEMRKAGVGAVEEQRDMTHSGPLKRASPTHCLVLNGKLPDCFMHTDIRTRGKAAGGLPATQEWNVTPEERLPLPSSHIPVPRHRNPSGHADKEVMAATVLTTLSTSPLVLNPGPPPTVAAPEPTTRGWKDPLSASYSSSTSGNWSWDTSDQSVPSTPSPPLSNDAGKSFLLASPRDDAAEDAGESTHFLFDDPIPRKRKNSMKVMFKCLWKNCEKVLSTSSGIQRHVRTVHLGRSSDSDYSDGEEDFYYSEIEVNMDSLTEGLSSLTPTSPTTLGPPPFFPRPVPDADAPHSQHIFLRGPPCHAASLLSQSAPSTLCHIRTDHAYQGPVTPVRSVSIGEKRQPATNTHTTGSKNHALAMVAPKPAPGIRKPRGEAKKCRKVYGMEKKDMWCTACRWKKACQRFTD